MVYLPTYTLDNPCDNTKPFDLMQVIFITSKIKKQKKNAISVLLFFVPYFNLANLVADSLTWPGHVAVNLCKYKLSVSILTYYLALFLYKDLSVT